MTGETNLQALLKTMSPKLNGGDYVFCTTPALDNIDSKEIIGLFKEEESWTVILNKELADNLGLTYTYIAAWITLTVHSSLEAVGLTAAFATALGNEGISCNVVAAYYHDHIFVAKADAERAMEALKRLSTAGKSSTKISDILIGAVSADQSDEMQRHVKQMRDEWERNT